MADREPLSNVMVHGGRQNPTSGSAGPVQSRDYRAAKKHGTSPRELREIRHRRRAISARDEDRRARRFGHFPYHKTKTAFVEQIYGHHRASTTKPQMPKEERAKLTPEEYEKYKMHRKLRGMNRALTGALIGSHVGMAGGAGIGAGLGALGMLAARKAGIRIDPKDAIGFGAAGLGLLGAIGGDVYGMYRGTKDPAKFEPAPKKYLSKERMQELGK